MWDKGGIWGDNKSIFVYLELIQERRSDSWKGDPIAEKEITETYLWGERGRIQAHMENLGFARSRDTSFVVSGGEKKADPGARTSVRIDQEDICGPRRWGYLPSFPISTLTSPGVKSQNIFLGLPPVPMYWGGESRVEKAGSRGGGCNPRRRWANLLESHS